MKKLLVALLISMPLLATAEADYNIRIFNKTNKFIKLVPEEKSCIKFIHPDGDITLDPYDPSLPYKQITVRDSNNWTDWSNHGTRCNAEIKQATFKIFYSDFASQKSISIGKVRLWHGKNYKGDWETLLIDWADRPFTAYGFCSEAPAWGIKDCTHTMVGYISAKDLNIDLYIDYN